MLLHVLLPTSWRLALSRPRHGGSEMRCGTKTGSKSIPGSKWQALGNLRFLVFSVIPLKLFPCPAIHVEQARH